MCKEKRINKKYSAEFKISVILDKVKNNLGVKETVRKYELKSHNTLKLWERIYRNEGAEGLMKEKRGKKSIGRPRKKPADVAFSDDLITENKKLRAQLEYAQMEIECLKKLSALVLAEERENGKKPR